MIDDPAGAGATPSRSPSVVPSLFDRRGSLETTPVVVDSPGTGPQSRFGDDGAWKPRVMIADDIFANVELLSRILRGAGYTDVVVTTEGPDVLSTFRSAEPDIVMLDLHMPRADGLSIIQEIRRDSAAWIPIVVLTGDASIDAKRGTLRAGASDFIGKPYDMAEVVLRVGNLLETRRLQLLLARENETLERRVQQRTDELFAARLDVLQRLAVATEKRDDDTGEHTRRVGILAAEIASRLGASRSFIDSVRNAAPLHDIGKIAIPDAILNKPGRLTPAEFDVMKTHSAIGADILAGGNHRLIHAAEQIARTHHERWDGSGYPNGLCGEEIPIEGRITAVADYFDALSHNRVYRAALAVADVLQMIAEGSGTQFDPAVANAMLQIGEAIC
jgi:putative two-component system response regulator